MWVVKLGGSLFDYEGLGEWLKILSEEGAGKVVIVPGGGPFADQVRRAQKQTNFSDKHAHQMALHAMDQYGLMLAGIAQQQGYKLITASSKQEILSILKNKQTAVWLPSKYMENKIEIPQSWRVTSDSLSAWLANQLDAEKLILIKCVEIDPELIFAQLETQGILDEMFSSFVNQGKYRVEFLTESQQKVIMSMLID